MRNTKVSDYISKGLKIRYHCHCSDSFNKFLRQTDEIVSLFLTSDYLKNPFYFHQKVFSAVCEVRKV